MRTNSVSNGLKLVVLTTIQSPSCQAPGPVAMSSATSSEESLTGEGAPSQVQLCSFLIVPLRPKRLSCPPAFTKMPLLLPEQLPVGHAREPVNLIVTTLVGLTVPMGHAAVPACKRPFTSMRSASSEICSSGKDRRPPFSIVIFPKPFWPVKD